MNPTDFRVYKRLDPADPRFRDAPYYFAFAYQRKTYKRCLETNDKTEAQRRAKLRYKEIVGAVQREDYPTLERLKMRATTSATLQDLFTVYRSAPVDAGSKTREQNINALKQLICVTCAIEADQVEQASIRLITRGAAGRWFELATNKALAATDQDDQVTIKRTANSRFVQASSLFTPRALATYKDAGCHQRCLEEFSAAGDVYRFTRLPKTQYNPPPDAIIQATLAAWETIEDRNLFLAIGHELAFGLRAGELAQARWSWWQTREGYPVLDGQAAVKNHTNLVQVRALDPWFNIMAARIAAKDWRGQPEDFIITGTATNRTDGIFRAVSAWLRDQKWNTRKTNHAIRAYSGSQIAMRYGIYEAQSWLRHSTVKVTEGHYSHFVKKFKPTDLNTIAARWAVSQQPIPLRLVIAEPA